MSQHELKSLARHVTALAVRAGQKILEIYQTAFDVEHKPDQSPLTAADWASHEIILMGLQALTPGVPVWSEESSTIGFAERSRWREFWLVDPLDGTREFIRRNGEFTVNIALVREHAPVLGVIHVPVEGKWFFGGREFGSFASAGRGDPVRLAVCDKTEAPVRVAGSRSHAGASLAGFLRQLPGHRVISVGSSIKFCMIAEGKADVYPRLGPTSEWDTAAGQAIVEGAGGAVTDLGAHPLRYNLRPEPLNPFFVAFGDASGNWPAMLAAAQAPAPGATP